MANKLSVGDFVELENLSCSGKIVELFPAVKTAIVDVPVGNDNAMVKLIVRENELRPLPLTKLKEIGSLRENVIKASIWMAFEREYDISTRDASIEGYVNDIYLSASDIWERLASEPTPYHIEVAVKLALAQNGYNDAMEAYEGPAII